MSARPIATATISFGLVSIPVKIYPAGNASSGVHFNLVHRECGNRLKQQYVCPNDGVTVERAEMAKGYEFSKGQFVLFTDEELKALQEKATQTVDISEFVPLEKIDTIYYDTTYYLGPDKGGDRAFALLAKALTRSGRAALARYAARGKQYLVMVRPHGNALLMQQLYYADEIRPVSEVPLGETRTTPEELKLALQIIKQGVSNTFKPEQYQDDVKIRMLAAIEQKVQGKEITLTPEEPQAKVIDLMEALKSSLGQGRRKPARQAGRAEQAAPARASKKKKS
jgi:DNA end-binding protein Ku